MNKKKLTVAWEREKGGGLREYEKRWSFRFFRSYNLEVVRSNRAPATNIARDGAGDVLRGAAPVAL